jgi:DNA-binding response OmpR family regulator
MLPDINGNVVCQAVKRNPELAGTKIIIVSGVVNQSEIDELMNSGAEDFIRKPFDISDLVEKIAGVLQMN